MTMRFKQNFAQDRESEIIDCKPKYFIASEGSDTEPRYFEKLNKSVISENVTIINILRDYINRYKSHPTQIATLLEEFIKNSGNELTVLELKNKIRNWDHENPGIIDMDKVELKLDTIYKKDDYRIKNEVLESLFMNLFKGEVYEDMAKNFISYFEAQDVTYSPSVDTLNMVIDRDKDNFFEKQYDQVVKFCRENGVNLFVSNPNFEFWLFLHFPDVEKENRGKLLKNEKIGKRRYIERRLNEIFKYNKNSFNFLPLEAGIIDAIKREKLFEEDIEKLKTNLGSNVGLLVEKIIESKN